MERLRDLTSRIKIEAFSVERVLRACAAGEPLDGLEAEVCAETAHAMRQEPDEARPCIPWAALRSRMTRDLSASTDHALIATDVDPLDILRPFSIVARAGVSTLPNLGGDLQLTRTSATSTVSWMSSESASATATTPTVASTAMTPKNGIGIVQVSRRFSQQVNNLDAWLRRELSRTAATVVDQAVLQGSGSSGEPTGLVNVAGVSTQSGTSLAWADLLTMKANACTANADDATIAFVGTPAVRKLLEGRTRDTTGIGFVWQNNQIASCAAFASTLMPSATLVSGPLGAVYVGFWGAGIQVESNPYDPTLFKSGIVKWRVTVSVDVAIGCDPAAFTVASSIT
jgi:HK97 family phage major capsid protein